MAEKLKDRVDKLSATSSSTTKNISKLKATVASAKTVVDQAVIKVSALEKLSSGDARVQGGCAPCWRDES